MMRLSSYSRYFSTATPMQTGRAAAPRVVSPVTSGWVPQPGASPERDRQHRHRDHTDTVFTRLTLGINRSVNVTAVS